MSRKSIIDSLQAIATNYDYAFYAEEERYLAQGVKRLPALWLAPPKFHSKEGRTHGKITYSVTLHALTEGAKLPPTEREAAWEMLESDLVEIFSSLSRAERVIAIENLKIKCNIASLTALGEISATATAEVVTYY